MVPCDNDTTSSSLFALLDEVDLIETLPLVGSLELFSKVVVTDSASVDNRVRRKKVLNCAIFQFLVHDRACDLLLHHELRFGRHRQRRK